MNQDNLPLELGPVFLDVIANVKKKVGFDADKHSFYLRDKNKTMVDFDYVENCLTEAMAETELHYDEIGDEEFQRLLEFGLKVLDGTNQDFDEFIEDEEKMSNDFKHKAASEEIEEEEEYEDEEEYEEEEEMDESPETLHFEFINEIIEEMKANPDTDDEYLATRIRNGLRTKKISVNYLEN